MAFDKLDKDHSGFIDINDIRQCYDAKKNPDVISGKKTEDEVLGEFLDTFEVHHQDSKGPKDAKVDILEWYEYYAGVSMSIDDDAYFELMIRNAWHIAGGKGASANTTIPRTLVTHADGT